MQGAKITDLYNPASTFGQNGVDLSKLNLGYIISGGPLSIINLLFFIVGLAFFVNLSLAAMTYITAHGDPGNISKASSRITSSLLGLAISFTAFVIVRLVASLFGFGALVPVI